MSKVVLAYSDKFIGFDVSYNSDFVSVLPVGATGEQMELICLNNTNNISITTESGVFLNQKKYEHVLRNEEIFNIVISADELLESTKYDHVKNFWKAGSKYVCFDTITGKYIPVTCGGGLLPLEFISENKYLREVTLTLTTV